MALIKPTNNAFAKIKVIGVGGGGDNAVGSMVMSKQISGVDFIVVNTDAQALISSPVENKLQIGSNFTKGLGAGANPEVGQAAAEESREKIKEHLYDSDMVFITAGMGGGTGTGASPIIAEVAKEVGALTVAIVTKPFMFEGVRRMQAANEGIENLRDIVDTLIVVPNQRLLEVIDKKMTLAESFALADSVLGQGVQGISDLITVPGLINVDFKDVKTIMAESGTALMGVGESSGENRAVAAARGAISSPLLELSIDGAKGVLYNIIGGPDMTMDEVADVGNIIAAAADPDANIIFGAVIKEEMEGRMKISVIATGFEEQQLTYNPQGMFGAYSRESEKRRLATNPAPKITIPSGTISGFNSYINSRATVAERPANDFNNLTATPIDEVGASPSTTPILTTEANEAAINSSLSPQTAASGFTSAAEIAAFGQRTAPSAKVSTKNFFGNDEQRNQDFQRPAPRNIDLNAQDNITSSSEQSAMVAPQASDFEDDFDIPTFWRQQKKNSL